MSFKPVCNRTNFRINLLTFPGVKSILIADIEHRFYICDFLPDQVAELPAQPRSESRHWATVSKINLPGRPCDGAPPSRSRRRVVFAVQHTGTAVANPLVLSIIHSPFRFSYKKNRSKKPCSDLVEEGGFEPPKRNATDLQSAPFGHSGTPPYLVGAGGRIRTPDLLITNQLLYRLSYTSKWRLSNSRRYYSKERKGCQVNSKKFFNKIRGGLQ